MINEEALVYKRGDLVEFTCTWAAGQNGAEVWC